jgi:hypothetical protein
MRVVTALVSGIAISLAAAATANAQVAPIGFLNLNFGATQPVSTTFKIPASAFGASVDVDYHLKRAPVIDVGGGVLFGRGFGFGVSVSHLSEEQPATVMVRVPLSLTQSVSATKESAPLGRSETAVHLQLVYQLPLGRLNVAVSGGPSYFSAKQKLVGDLDLIETGPVSFAISTLQIEQHDASAWGFNVGADLSYFFVRSFGVGGLVRYSRATVTLPNLFLTSATDRPVNQDVDVGGITVGGGVRFRF